MESYLEKNLVSLRRKKNGENGMEVVHTCDFEDNREPDFNRLHGIPFIVHVDADGVGDRQGDSIVDICGGDFGKCILPVPAIHLRVVT
jgi:hypothetical protein